MNSACKKYYLDIRSYKKIAAFTDEERLEYFTTKRKAKSNEKFKTKMKLVSEVRAAYKEGNSKRTIAKMFKLSRKTVTKYLDENFTPIHASIGVRKKSILDPYKQTIDDLILTQIKSVIMRKL